jgi:hypothetical protein
MTYYALVMHPLVSPKKLRQPNAQWFGPSRTEPCGCVVAHLGKGANWGVAEHISHMLNRQIHLTKLRQEKVNFHFVLMMRLRKKHFQLLHTTNSSPRNSTRVRNSNIWLSKMEESMYGPAANWWTVTSLSPSKQAINVLATDKWHLIICVVMRCVQRVASTLRDLVVVGLMKRLSNRWNSPFG